jgi:succinate dehydrogenase / fumarate reductase cytochrome b subunit
MASPSPRLPDRPLSPHLSVYRFTWTMAMSIAHRISGMACYAALPLVVIWLWAVADSPGSYIRLARLAGSWPGILFLIGLSWAFIHHAIGGVRHIIWDTGVGLGDPARHRWAQGTLIGSISLTVLLWVMILIGRA